MKKKVVYKYLVLKKYKKSLLNNIVKRKKRAFKLKLYFRYLMKLKKRWIFRDFFRIGPVKRPIVSKKKSKFGRYLLLRQRIKTMYGYPKIKQLQKLSLNCYKSKNVISFFISKMEYKLDVILFHLGLFGSFKQVRQFILHGNVLINNSIARSYSQLIKSEDIICFKSNSFVRELKKKIFYMYKTRVHTTVPFLNTVEFFYENCTFIKLSVDFKNTHFSQRFNEEHIYSFLNFFRKCHW